MKNKDFQDLNRSQKIKRIYNDYRGGSDAIHPTNVDKVNRLLKPYNAWIEKDISGYDILIKPKKKDLIRRMQIIFDKLHSVPKELIDLDGIRELSNLSLDLDLDNYEFKND